MTFFGADRFLADIQLHRKSKLVWAAEALDSSTCVSSTQISISPFWARDTTAPTHLYQHWHLWSAVHCSTRLRPWHKQGTNKGGLSKSSLFPPKKVEVLLAAKMLAYEQNYVEKSWKTQNKEIASQALTNSMSVTTAQFTDKNSSPSAIKTWNNEKEEASSDYTHCIHFFYCGDEGRLTDFAHLHNSCFTYQSTEIKHLCLCLETLTSS